MKKVVGYICAGCILLCCLSCKKQFNPEIRDVSTNFLAVDGAIISGDSTFISLSRTTSLKDTTQNKAELKAVLSIENDQKVLYPLIEKGKGKYALGVTNFDPARRYRLNIKTSNGSTYQSDFVPMKATPPIDSIYFKQPDDQSILFYADTHDGNNKTKYYRWDYKETWAYTSYYGGIRDSTAYLRYVYAGGNVNDQYPKRVFVGTCYGTAVSNEILLSSTAKLSNDVIKGQQIGRITANSQKINKLYNMQLHQYALTEDGFNYYQNLKKNTEQLGSIFDEQPSITSGNIHCLNNPAERVIGFVSVSTISTKIFTMSYQDIPLRVEIVHPGDCIAGPAPCLNNFAYYVGPPDTLECQRYGGNIPLEPASTFSTRIRDLYASTPYALMITGANYGVVNGVRQIIGYNYYKKDCVDCRAMPGGANATYDRPTYFPAFQ